MSRPRSRMHVAKHRHRRDGDGMPEIILQEMEGLSLGEKRKPISATKAAGAPPRPRAGACSPPPSSMPRPGLPPWGPRSRAEASGVRQDLPRMPQDPLVLPHEALRGHGRVAPALSDGPFGLPAGRRHLLRRVPHRQRGEERGRDAEGSPQVRRCGPRARHLQPQGLRRLRRKRRRRRVLPPGRQGQARGRGPEGGNQGLRCIGAPPIIPTQPIHIRHSNVYRPARVTDSCTNV